MLIFSSFHRTGFGRRKFCGGGPSVVASLRGDVEKEAALVIGANWRTGAVNVRGFARSNVAAALLVAILYDCVRPGMHLFVANGEREIGFGRYMRSGGQ